MDLFQTLWGIIEHPTRTFRTIARAEQKNYVFFLFAVGGVVPAMWCFHAFGLGEFFPSLLTTLPLGVLSGLILGMFIGPLAAGATSLLSPFMGGDATYRNALGGIAYAFVPTIVLGLVTLPIQWLTFGSHQFTLNPHPETINPASYWALNILQWLSAVWSLGLLFLGIRTTMRLGWLQAAVPTAVSLLVLAGMWYGVFILLHGVLLESGIYYSY